MKKVFLFLMVLLAVCMMITSITLANDWPERSPTCVIGYDAGGGTDTAIRPIIVEMEKFLDEPITVVNMSGGSSAVACDYVLQRPADGYWWYGTGGEMAAVTHRVMNYVDTNWREWETLIGMTGPDGVVVRGDSDLKTIDDVIELIKNQETVVGVTGMGSGLQITFDEVAKAVGAKKLTWVPHGGCHPTGVAVIKGEIKFAPVTLSAVWEFIRSGDLKILLVWGQTEPLEVKMADGSTYSVPTVGQIVPELAYLDGLLKSWPIFVKREVPIEIRDKIREAFVYACNQPSVSEASLKVGLQLTPMVGETADRIMSFIESNQGWILWETGQAEKSPEEFGIPRPEDWVWPPEGWDMTQYPMKGE